MKAIMKKKGFTLVELLAVIAILAILVIIALPNVMSMFNQAKENSFTTEIKEIYKQAQQQWISDSMMNTNEIKYWRVGGTSASSINDTKGIDLTGRTELNYYIVIDKAGKVKEYYASDGSYQYAYVGSGLEVENIGKASGDDTKYLVTDSGKIITTNKDASSAYKIENNVVNQISSIDQPKQTLSISPSGATLPTAG